MFCCYYFIFFCFFAYKILQLNAFDEENNDIFAKLWQKSEEIGTKSGNCKETLRTNSNDNLISQKNGKIKKEIVVKDEPNDYDEFDQFSNERQQKIALNKNVKEENVEKRVKSEFMEFDRFSDKEEFDNGKDGEEQSTESYSLFDNSNLKDSSSKSQKGIRKIYSDVEKQKIIAKFDNLKEELKTRANGMSYDMTKVNEKFAQKLGVSRMTIYRWKRQFGDSSIKKIYSEVEKQEKVAEFDELKNEFKTRAKGMSYDMTKVNEKIAQKLGVSQTSINSWKHMLGISKKHKMPRKKEENEKWEIIKKFIKMKDEFHKRDLAGKEIDKKIAQKLGVSRSTIFTWKKQFGISKKLKRHTDAEKIKLLKKFYKIKKRNPQICKDEIAQRLNIPITNLNRWEKKSESLFRPAVDNGGPISNVQRNSGSEGSTSSANSLNDIPWKWNDFRKKRNERVGKFFFNAKIQVLIF